ncbi:hypothetical protein ALC62_15172, partial [Cyphomyrmex costatus]
KGVGRTPQYPNGEAEPKELGELWLGVMGMVLLGVLLDNIFDFMVAVLPVVGMLACVFSNGLTAVGFTG